MIGKIAKKAVGDDDQGFTLLELMVVIAIVAVLAFGVTTMYMNPVLNVKGSIFNFRADIGYARGEAVRRNEPVLIQFDFNLGVPAADGYRLCVQDPAPANAANFDNDCDDVTDEVIKQEVWDQVVQFYDRASDGTAGPNVVPPGVPVLIPLWPNPAAADNDGVTFPQNDTDLCDCFRFYPDGSADSNGEVYLYAPGTADTVNSLKTPPYTLLVSQTGSVQMYLWRPGAGWVQR